MNALNKIAALAADGTKTRGEKDLELWHAWKKSPNDENTSALLKQVHPLIIRESTKWNATMAQPLLETEGKQLAVHAFKTYDPTKGAALGTHVANNLQKMSRLVYENQNAARLPEHEMLKFHSFHKANAALSDELGREPTSDELADHLGWSLPYLAKYRTSVGRKELLESGGAEESGSAGLFEDEGTDHTLDFIHHGLNPTQRAILEHTVGMYGAEILSPSEIQKKLGLKQSTFSYQRSLLVKHIESVQNGGKK